MPQILIADDSERRCPAHVAVVEDIVGGTLEPRRAADHCGSLRGHGERGGMSAKQRRTGPGP
ncbi:MULTISPECIES: hypothetical protein [Streptomyces]|uniref:hypothetical protein n=1 Tax=Streptomyces lycopersici TaxID=2974589 RepID=UPI0021CF219B|nr:hypothetical protein [Streptomyces sp. NEAU-383]